MNKAELIAKIATTTGVSKSHVEVTLMAFTNVITEEIKQGTKVTLKDFGTFSLKERAERKGVNPQTQEAITIKASKVPVFKAGKAFKDSVQ